jgi:hypothetical protein
MKTMFIVFLSITAIFNAYAQQGVVLRNDKVGWLKIGETIVDFQTERDEIYVMGADRFSAIKFKVDDEPINLISLEIYYDKGDKQEFPVNLSIKAAGESKIIDLDGDERSIRKIVFIYRTLPNRKDVKARVEIWGLKTNFVKSK